MWLHTLDQVHHHLGGANNSNRSNSKNANNIRLKKKRKDIIYLIQGEYLSNATCLMRPHLCYVFFVVSRIIIMCYTIRPPVLKKSCVRQVVLDK